MIRATAQVSSPAVSAGTTTPALRPLTGRSGRLVVAPAGSPGERRFVDRSHTKVDEATVLGDPFEDGYLEALAGRVVPAPVLVDWRKRGWL